MITLTGTVVGETVINRAFTRLVAGVQDFSEVFEKIGEDFRDIEKEQFDAEPWVPLSPAYAVWKELHFPGQSLLRLTDRLYSSMTSLGGPDNVNIIQPLQATFGAGGESGRYGVFHQLGTMNMPQRKVIDFTEDDKRMFTKTMHTYMVRLGADSGFAIV